MAGPALVTDRDRTGRKDPIPPVRTTAFASMVRPAAVVTVDYRALPRRVVSPVACSSEWVLHREGVGLLHQSSPPVPRPLTLVKPATSKISFSGYIAVICPPGSGSVSSTTVSSPEPW